VFGTKVLKGTWATYEANEMPLWAEYPHWNWVYETKGGQDAEEFTALKTSELEEAELEELQEQRWADEGEDEEDEGTEGEDE
jgi:hypothetical protein